MLIAADDALDTVVDSYLRLFSNDLFSNEDNHKVDDKFRKVLNLLSDFAKAFPLKDPILYPNIGRTVRSVTGEVKIGNSSKFPTVTTILQALKKDLLSNVKFPSISLFLNADGYWILANGL